MSDAKAEEHYITRPVSNFMGTYDPRHEELHPEYWAANKHIDLNETQQFGFSILIGTLSAVVLGGRRTVFGPMVGTTILVLLPEIFRPLADYRQAVYGLLLVVVMAFMPFGVYDSIKMRLHNRKLARAGMLNAKAAS